MFSHGTLLVGNLDRVLSKGQVSCKSYRENPTVSRSSLLLNCWKSWKISILASSSILEWVTDYLTGRSQNVVVNGESSRPAPVISGVPQGSVLGPLLFLIYINDLSEINLCQGAKLTLYADDVLLYRAISSPEDFVTLQEDINKVGNWSSTNFLTLNRAKNSNL